MQKTVDFGNRNAMNGNILKSTQNVQKTNIYDQNQRNLSFSNTLPPTKNLKSKISK